MQSTFSLPSAVHFKEKPTSQLLRVPSRLSGERAQHSRSLTPKIHQRCCSSWGAHGETVTRSRPPTRLVHQGWLRRPKVLHVTCIRTWHTAPPVLSYPPTRVCVSGQAKSTWAPAGQASRNIISRMWRKTCTLTLQWGLGRHSGRRFLAKCRMVVCREYGDDYEEGRGATEWGCRMVTCVFINQIWDISSLLLRRSQSWFIRLTFFSSVFIPNYSPTIIIDLQFWTWE